VREAVDVGRRENKTPAELKGILAKFVLTMPARLRAIAALEIVASGQVQQISGTQVGDGVSLALFVDQQGNRYSGFFAENPCIVSVAKADGGKRRALVQKGLLVFAQLRDLLAAKNSAIVPQKNNDGRLVLPQRTETDFPPGDVRKNDICELPAESFLHVELSSTSRHSTVKTAPDFSFSDVCSRNERSWRLPKLKSLPDFLAGF
jgi:hypothetical protein